MSIDPRLPISILLLSLAVLYLPWTWSEQLGGLGADPSVYLLSARHYAPFLSADPVASAVAVQSQFPPLYPIVLMLTGGAASVPLAHAVTVLTMLLAVGATYLWLRTLGLGIAVAVFGAGLFGAAPGTWTLMLVPNSEGLYAALLLAGLALLGGRQKVATRARAGLAAVLFCAALLTRSAGVALLPAWLAVRAGSQNLRAVAGAIGIAAPAFAWGLLHRTEWSYADDIAALLSGPAPAQVASQAWMGFVALWHGALENLVPFAGLEAAVVPLLIFATIVAVVRMVRLEADAWYAGVYVAILSIWPYHEEARRFAWPLLPFLIGYALWGFAGIARGWPARIRRPAAGLAMAAAFLSLVPGPGFAFAWQRWGEAEQRGLPSLRRLPEWYGRDLETSYRHGRVHLALARALGELPLHVPPGDCVISTLPPVVAFHGGRDGVTPPAPSSTDADFRQALSGTGCRYVLLLAAMNRAYPEPFYPGERIIAEARAVRVWTVGGGDAQASRVVAVLAENPT